MSGESWTITNTVNPNDAQIKAMLESADDQPIVMVNLLKFREKALYPDGRDAHLSGRDAYMRYGAGVVPLIEKVGGRMLFGAPVRSLLIGESSSLWDQVALAEYPSRAALAEMSQMPEYREIHVHREAGLAGQLNIETTQAIGALTS